MKTIVLHDYFENPDGGGRLALIAAKGLHADLAYGFKSKKHPFFLNDKGLLNEITVSRHNINFQLLKQFLICRAFLHKTAFIKKYDSAVYSGYYSPLAVGHFSQVCRNVYYCHTPPRFIYDQKDFYLSLLPFVLRPVLKMFINYLQPRYEKAISEMDCIVTNSKNVQKRVKNFLGYNSRIIYPPCDIDHFKWIDCQGYYLSTARLDPLKRVDLIVKAFMMMPDKKLIVTSGGSELTRLRKLAEGFKNITFTGWVSEDHYRELLGSCVATLYIPCDEDFGLSPIESMAAGKPVIGTAEGGLLETVVHEKTGLLVTPLVQEEDVINAVGKLTRSHAHEMRESCESQARMFSQQKFIKEMRSATFV